MVGGSEEGEAEERGSVSSQERSEVVDTRPDYFFSCSPFFDTPWRRAGSRRRPPEKSRGSDSFDSITPEVPRIGGQRVPCGSDEMTRVPGEDSMARMRREAVAVVEQPVAALSSRHFSVLRFFTFFPPMFECQSAWKRIV